MKYLVFILLTFSNVCQALDDFEIKQICLDKITWVKDKYLNDKANIENVMFYEGMICAYTMIILTIDECYEEPCVQED